MTIGLHDANILCGCKQWKFAVFSKILFVVGNNDITATSKGTLILKHILKILTYLSCFKCTRTIVKKIDQYIGIQKDFFHFPMIYAKRSSLAMSSLVMCPIPRNCKNSSGSSGNASQSMALSTAFALERRLRGLVIRRRALMAFSIMFSSVIMIFNSRNNSAFICIAVITSFF